MLKKLLYIFASLGIFAALLIFPKAAAEAVKDGLIMCGQVIIPSLFPFFIATNLLNELGASKLISNALAPFGARLGISGHGVSAFIIGVEVFNVRFVRPMRNKRFSQYVQHIVPCDFRNICINLFTPESTQNSTSFNLFSLL